MSTSMSGLEGGVVGFAVVVEAAVVVEGVVGPGDVVEMDSVVVAGPVVVTDAVVGAGVFVVVVAVVVAVVEAGGSLGAHAARTVSIAAKRSRVEKKRRLCFMFYLA